MTERCDRCGARAQARVRTPSGLELVFCSHHYNEFKPALEKAEVITLTLVGA